MKELFNTDEDILYYSLLLLDELQNVVKNLEGSLQSANMNDANN